MLSREAFVDQVRLASASVLREIAGFEADVVRVAMDVAAAQVEIESSGAEVDASRCECFGNGKTCEGAYPLYWRESVKDRMATWCGSCRARHVARDRWTQARRHLGCGVQRLVQLSRVGEGVSQAIADDSRE